jgi:hypothetical protein
MIQTCSWCHEPNDVSSGRTFCARCGHRADLPRLGCDCKECRWFVVAWPDSLGWDVYDRCSNHALLARVHDDPGRPGMSVRTFGGPDAPDRVLELLEKTDPADASLRCLSQGNPAEEGGEP